MRCRSVQVCYSWCARVAQPTCQPKNAPKKDTSNALAISVHPGPKLSYLFSLTSYRAGAMGKTMPAKSRLEENHQQKEQKNPFFCSPHKNSEKHASAQTSTNLPKTATRGKKSCLCFDVQHGAALYDTQLANLPRIPTSFCDRLTVLLSPFHILAFSCERRKSLGAVLRETEKGPKDVELESRSSALGGPCQTGRSQEKGKRKTAKDKKDTKKETGKRNGKSTSNETGLDRRQGEGRGVCKTRRETRAQKDMSHGRQTKPLNEQIDKAQTDKKMRVANSG